MDDEAILRWSCGEPVKEGETYAEHLESCPTMQEGNDG